MKPIHRDWTEEDEADLRLLGRVREGDLDAFSDLLRRRRPGVEGFLYRLFWDRQKAEDGAQEVFLRLWAARERYQPRARPRTLLYRIAQNYWRDEMRKSHVRPPEVGWPGEGGDERSLPAISAPLATEPLRHLFHAYRQQQIRAAISALPERYRLVFVLAHLEERKLAEIAEILEIPEGTVKSRLHTAVRILRDRLTAEDENEEMP